MRIIAGTARGRLFEAPEGLSTRPTLDRVREAMFGMIQFDVPGSAVLDLFAGSGGLGLEALSRGAESCDFCDSSRKACEIVSRNCRNLGFLRNTAVHCSDCFNLLERVRAEGRKFSLVLLDPPYEAGLYEPVFKALIEKDLLEDGCIVLAEHPVRLDIDPKLECLKAGKPHRYGDVAVTKFIYESGQNALGSKE